MTTNEPSSHTAAAHAIMFPASILQGREGAPGGYGPDCAAFPKGLAEAPVTRGSTLTSTFYKPL